LQPAIEELFWAAGKNHIANDFVYGIKTKDMFRRLCDGWYGNAERFEEGDNEFHMQKQTVRSSYNIQLAAPTAHSFHFATIYLGQLVHLPLVSTMSVKPQNQVDDDDYISVTDSTA
jgi:hypothetical protein